MSDEPVEPDDEEPEFGDADPDDAYVAGEDDEDPTGER